MFDELLVLNRPLSEQDVLRLYHAQEKDPASADERKWRWLTEGLRLPLQFKRNREGSILESRIIFDEDMHWSVSREAADRVLTRVKSAGFNVYVPCVWHGNGTYYPSPLAPPDPALAPILKKGDDPLAYLIAQAHRMGIEVHPWFTVVKRENDRYPQFSAEGTPAGAFDVHNGEFRRFIRDLMLDVVRRYDVDGVNLDYIRTMGVCTSRACQEDYRQQTGYSFWPDYYLRGVVGSSRDRIQAWQDAAVADIVSPFSREAKKIKPHVVISVDGHPYGRNAIRPLEGRDELRWANEGWVDVVFHMDYNQTIDLATVEGARTSFKNPEQLVLLFGNYDAKEGQAVARPGELIAQYAGFSQRRWPGGGVALYLYNLLTEDQIRALKRGPFQDVALPYWASASSH
jgi:uncharacterized lipoprotein YddW (UPF0748 family)